MPKLLTFNIMSAMKYTLRLRDRRLVHSQDTEFTTADEGTWSLGIKHFMIEVEVASATQNNKISLNPGSQHNGYFFKFWGSLLY